jgi:thymidine phosphorylase
VRLREARLTVAFFFWFRTIRMLFTDIIRTKRDKGQLTPQQIDVFVAGLTDASLPAEQVSALAMAIFLNSMTPAETGALTRAMARSGRVIDWNTAGLGGPVVDKHSTGGVGDKVSLVLAPIAAACGCFVPMVSGRGLGHSGGTLDKLDSIPGYLSTPDFGAFQRVVKTVGCAIIGPTDDLAPADRRLYAIRDVTSTVESIPLITASILSKKIAAGSEALVMDIKTGSGAFMATLTRARELASSIIATSQTIGLEVSALITDMSEVLGHSAGNAVEVKEAVHYLTGEQREPRLDQVVRSCCELMLVISGLSGSTNEAQQRVEAALSSGRAAEVFSRMVAAMGGPADFIDDVKTYLPEAPVSMPVSSDEEGYLASVDARAVGNAIIELGGGRRKADDKLDLSVGFTGVIPVGTSVDRQAPLCIVHAASREAAQRAAAAYREACTVSNVKPEARPMVLEKLSGTARSGQQSGAKPAADESHVN